MTATTQISSDASNKLATIPETTTATYRITAVASYNVSEPSEIRLVNKSNGAIYGIAEKKTVEPNAANASVTVIGYVATGVNITVEVQAKYAIAGNNYIRLIVEKISN